MPPFHPTPSRIHSSCPVSVSQLKQNRKNYAKIAQKKSNLSITLTRACRTRLSGNNGNSFLWAAAYGRINCNDFWRGSCLPRPPCTYTRTHTHCPPAWHLIKLFCTCWSRSPRALSSVPNARHPFTSPSPLPLPSPDLTLAPTQLSP